MKISATIITLNEESNIKAACESVAWADEIVVVDSESTDGTRAIAEACGARVITNPWPGFGAQKQFAVDQAQHEWIFSLDADERVSDELKKSIESLRQKPDLADVQPFYKALVKSGRFQENMELARGHFARGIERRLSELPRARSIPANELPAIAFTHAGALLSLLT